MTKNKLNKIKNVKFFKGLSVGFLLSLSFSSLEAAIPKDQNAEFSISNTVSKNLANGTSCKTDNLNYCQGTCVCYGDPYDSACGTNNCCYTPGGLCYPNNPPTL